MYKNLFVLFVPLLLIFITIASTLFGGIAGWIVGWFFDETILGILAQIGITNVSMFQIGAFLGFIGSFFKSNISTTN